MKGFDVIHAKSAVKTRNKMDLSAPVLATMDIGQIVPLGTWEMIPGDDFKVGLNAFSRLAPLVEPTYGKVQFKTVKAFVPYHQIAWDSDAWLAGKTTWEGQTPHGRFITIADLFNFVYTYCAVSTGATQANADFSYVNSSGSKVYMLFTIQGKYWLKVLNALGYAVPQGVDLQSTSYWSTNIKSIKLSAYPFLAFFKLYNDYMSQSQRYNTSILSSYLQDIKYGKSIAGGYYTASTGIVSYQCMKAMFDCLLLNYENDYFTSAWQNPNAALSLVENITGATVPGDNNGASVLHTIYDTDLKNDNGTPGNSFFLLGQRATDMLRRFDDWVRRNNYSGSRAVQQLYSRFGIKTDDYKSHYAHILDTDVIPIQIGDVTATASTSPGSSPTSPIIPLGDYAGKGIMSAQIGCAYKSSDFGMLFILGYYTVTPLNAYGFDRSVLRSDPFDYYNPEFDGLGADAISLMEVFENPRGVADSDTSNSDSVFGFTERYNSYRYGRPKILGDFRKYVNNDPMNSWHTGRLLGDIRKAGNLVAQSSAFNTLPQTDSEYNRIFSVTSGDVDHFYLTCYFDVSAVRPMLNLNQVPNLGEGDTAVPRNGNVIS